MKERAKVERKSEREVVVTRMIDGPPRLVYEAWTTAALFQQWWVPKSVPITLLSCELDVRVGGGYRLVFAAGSDTMEFFGKYLEAVPCSRLVWTNDEGGEAAAAITTVTFEEVNGKTLLTVSDLHPTKEALDGAGAMDAMPESLDQLDALLATLPR